MSIVDRIRELFGGKESRGEYGAAAEEPPARRPRTIAKETLSRNRSRSR